MTSWIRLKGGNLPIGCPETPTSAPMSSITCNFGICSRNSVGANERLTPSLNRAKHGLRRGEVGTVVERWKDGAYEVEFSDDSGGAYAFAALPAEQLMKLHFRKDKAA